MEENENWHKICSKMKYGECVCFTFTCLPFHIALFHHITQIKMNHDYSYKFMYALRNLMGNTLFSEEIMVIVIFLPGCDGFA